MLLYYAVVAAIGTQLCLDFGCILILLYYAVTGAIANEFSLDLDGIFQLLNYAVLLQLQ